LVSGYGLNACTPCTSGKKQLHDFTIIIVYMIIIIVVVVVVHNHSITVAVIIIIATIIIIVVVVIIMVLIFIIRQAGIAAVPLPPDLGSGLPFGWTKVSRGEQQQLVFQKQQPDAAPDMRTVV
jgi:hypothetical protein